jgi:hypothetical protein
MAVRLVREERSSEAQPRFAIAFRRDVPEVNADPEEHAAVLGQALVADPQHPLDSGGALDCV